MLSGDLLLRPWSLVPGPSPSVVPRPPPACWNSERFALTCSNSNALIRGRQVRSGDHGQGTRRTKDGGPRTSERPRIIPI